jgi:hypothetical protein
LIQVKNNEKVFNYKFDKLFVIYNFLYLFAILYVAFSNFSKMQMSNFIAIAIMAFTFWIIAVFGVITRIIKEIKFLSSANIVNLKLIGFEEVRNLSSMKNNHFPYFIDKENKKYTSISPNKNLIKGESFKIAINNKSSDCILLTNSNWREEK